MEDNRERLGVIVAGYPDEMKAFILKLHQKAIPWPDGMNRGNGWFDWRQCPVDLKQPKASVDQVNVAMKELMKNLCQITGVNLKRLRQGIKGSVGNPERRFAVRALAGGTYMTHREVGEQLGMTTQHVAREVRRNPEGIACYHEWMEKWREKYPRKLSSRKLETIVMQISDDISSQRPR